MKPLKILGLAALAALVAMAFVGATSAMAESTALCQSDEGTCAEANRVSHIHEATSEGSKAFLLSFVKVECDVLFLGDVQNAGNLGNPLEILGDFTWSNCKTSGGTSCTVAEVSGTDTKISVLKSGHELAAVTGAGEFTFKCTPLISCTYNWTGLQAHAFGPLLSEAENGETKLEKQVLNRVKGFCPETSELDLLTTSLEIEVITKLKTYIAG